MTTHTDETLILRNQAGDIYAISAATLQSGRVPDDKKQALEQALSSEQSGDVAGFIFDVNSFQNAFTNLSQRNTNVGSNFVLGGLVGLNNQSLSQLGVNVGNVSSTQAKL